MAEADFREYILNGFSQRRKLDPALTLSKFAAELGMSPQKLNSVLKQGSGLSTVAARNAAAGLGLTGEVRDHFVDLVDASHSRLMSARDEALERIRLYRAKQSIDTLTSKEFAPIASWESIAAFVLVETAGFKPNVEWAAKRLGLSVEKTKHIYDELFTRGFLRLENERWVCDSFTFNIEAAESVPALREYYSQLNLQAVEFLKRNPPDKRHFASAVLSVSEDDFDFIREEIEVFRKSLVAKLESRNRPRGRVGVLNLQIFPIDRNAK